MKPVRRRRFSCRESERSSATASAADVAGDLVHGAAFASLGDRFRQLGGLGSDGVRASVAWRRSSLGGLNRGPHRLTVQLAASRVGLFGQSSTVRGTHTQIARNCSPSSPGFLCDLVRWSVPMGETDACV